MVVIGASAGGLTALIQLVSMIPPSKNAAYCVVLHISSKSVSSYLIDQLSPHTKLKCVIAKNDAPIRADHIYVAPPDTHLLVGKNKILVGHGAKENRWRPSVDVLFRSAAVAYTSHCIGMVLTGLLDDGTAGMLAIQQCGGTTIVQDPREAEFADMPLSVLNAMDVNYCVRLEEMGRVLTTALGTTHPEIEPPALLVAESEIAAKVATSVESLTRLKGKQTIYACPDCGGPLFELTNKKLSRYRCYVGHTYTERDLLIKQAETLETTLWVALRMMEERRNMLLLMKERAEKRNFTRLANENDEKANELIVHIDRLKEVLFDAQRNAQPSGSG